LRRDPGARGQSRPKTRDRSREFLSASATCISSLTPSPLPCAGAADLSRDCFCDLGALRPHDSYVDDARVRSRSPTAGADLRLLVRRATSGLSRSTRRSRPGCGASRDRFTPESDRRCLAAGARGCSLSSSPNSECSRRADEAADPGCPRWTLPKHRCDSARRHAGPGFGEQRGSDQLRDACSADRLLRRLHACFTRPTAIQGGAAALVQSPRTICPLVGQSASCFATNGSAVVGIGGTSQPISRLGPGRPSGLQPDY
jgi:hypothetical protein